MDDPDSALRERARRAYEIGRLAAALRRSVLLLPAIGIALLCCDRPTATLASGAGLVFLVTFCLWRGQDYRRGVRPGLVAGLLSFPLPPPAPAGGQPCSS